jgi:hypothetical protein
MISRREVSACEVLGAHLQRIEEVKGAVVQSAQDARERALAADRRLPRGEGVAGVLHGVPFTVKDNIETAGIVTAAGAHERANTIPRRDGTVVSLIRRRRDLALEGQLSSRGAGAAAVRPRSSRLAALPAAWAAIRVAARGSPRTSAGCVR